MVHKVLIVAASRRTSDGARRDIIVGVSIYPGWAFATTRRSVEKGQVVLYATERPYGVIRPTHVLWRSFLSIFILHCDIRHVTNRSTIRRKARPAFCYSMRGRCRLTQS